MKWADSLIRIAKFEVEALQKKLAEIAERRAAAEMKLMMLQAEAEAERLNAQRDAQIGWYMIGFQEGMKARMSAAQYGIDCVQNEEVVAREALAHAFEELKKYEQVAQNAKTATLKTAEQRETAQMDEMGLRRAANY